ncbi:MAG: sigma-70 family RNA polymerase sigma factor [bacterium]|nr:sigma-70 family RNA polymerase sigma factor [bacterium]
MNPEELLRETLSGDESAFVALLDLFEQPVFAYFRWRRVSRPDAEDLTQQVFLTLLERGGRFDRQLGSLRGFLFGIARRVWLKHAAARGKVPQPIGEDIVDEQRDPPEDHPRRAARSATVAQATDDPPEASPNVLALRMHHNLSVHEIADVLEIPCNTVKSHLFRARNRIRHGIASKLDLNEGK